MPANGVILSCSAFNFCYLPEALVICTSRSSKFSFISFLFLSSGLFSWPAAIEDSVVLQGVVAVVGGQMSSSENKFHGNIWVMRRRGIQFFPLKLLNFWESSSGLSSVVLLSGLTVALISLSKMCFSANSSFSSDGKNACMSPGWTYFCNPRVWKAIQIPYYIFQDAKLWGDLLATCKLCSCCFFSD